MKSLLLFPLLLVSAYAEWGGCISSTSTEEDLVQKDAKTAVCLTIGENIGDWAGGIEYRRLSFAPMADDYSRFTVQGSFKQFVSSGNDNKNVTVFSSSQTSLSFIRKYYDADVGVYPYLTAIIDVKDGVVQGIAWDDACVFCSNDRCAENTFDFTGSPAFPKEPTKGCFLTTAECTQLHAANGNDCDLTLYVVWTGTDKNGKYLTSSTKRFSAFSPKQVKDQIKDGIDKLVPDFDFGSFF